MYISNLTYLHYAIPFFILVSFILYIAMISLNRKNIRNFFLDIDKKTWIALLLIFVVALAVRITVPAHAHAAIEEYNKIDMARSMLQTGSKGPHPDFAGWPFILSIAFAFFGIDNYTAIYACVFLGALTVFPLFFLTYAISRKKHLSLVPPLLLSLYFPHVRWSATARDSVCSLFFVLLALSFFFAYYKKKDSRSLWLAFSGLIFAVQIRPENYILLPLFYMGGVMHIRNFARRQKVKLIIPMLVFMIIPMLGSSNFIFETEDLWQNTSCCHEDYCSSFGSWSFRNLLFNSANFGPYVFNGKLQPTAFVFFSLMGLAYMLKNRRKNAFFMLGWFCLTWVVYFYSYFQALIDRSRFFIMFFPITAIFAGYGVILVSRFLSCNKAKINKLVIILVGLALAAAFLPYSVKTEKARPYVIEGNEWLACIQEELLNKFDDDCLVLETRIPRLAEKDIPGKCAIITSRQEIFKATTEFTTYGPEEVMLNPSGMHNRHNCTLFYDDESPGSQEHELELFRFIRTTYDLRVYKSYSEGNCTFTFYRLVDTKTP